jgi:hypothetical protein
MSLTPMALMNIDGYKPKYTWKGHVSYYVWGLNKIKSYFKQNNSSLFKTYQISADLRRLLCEQVVCLITEKKRSILMVSGQVLLLFRFY